MRIVAGSAKGTRLAPVPPGVRPLADRAREGLFASLGDRIPDAQVLDLFAGTGAVGIEALSRGAARCTFVEAARRVGDTIRDNLQRTRCDDRAEVVTSDALAFMRRHRGASPWDLVVMDPPYEVGGDAMDDLLAALAAPDRLAPGFTVVLTRAAKGSRGSAPVVPLQWAAARELRYGDSILTLYRRADQEA
ncbi:MAG: 16S rRNA (guanine(966)-N(2))-methyltransferase RsmD [Actinomycetota bacterium]